MRKVRGIETSLYLCLPKYWCDQNGLTKNTLVELELLSESELIVRVKEGISND